MVNVFQSILIIIFLIASQLVVYLVFLRPYVSTWGATKHEVSMPMAGDDITPHIASTRAIDIDAPKSETWRWLMQLGADRGGFYSYYFIEKALGYISSDSDKVEAGFKDFEVGDEVRASLEESGSIIPFHFPVLSVKAEESLVLGNWGTFKVVDLSENKSRLIVRSHEQERSNILARIADICLSTPLHFIMERRTLMGIKERVETGSGAKFPITKDVFWFAGILLSLIALFALLFISQSLSSILLLFILSTLWTVSLFVFEPIPFYSLSVAVTIISLVIIWNRFV